MMSFATGTAPSPVWCGVALRAGEIVTLGPGQSAHARSDGHCRWGAIRLPVEDLSRYGRSLIGAPFDVPSVPRIWRPSPAAGRDLHQLHAAAIRLAQARPQALADTEAAHGLEQQLIHAIVDCLPAGSACADIPVPHWHQTIMSRFESLLESQPDRNLRMAEICAALGVSDRLLRSLCIKHLGMRPTGYVRLHRMSLVRRALRRGDQGAASVSEAVRRYGFRECGSFAAGYRALFGELPSVTLRRRLRAGTAALARRL